MNPQATLVQIASEVSKCQACSLHSTRTLSVPGEGPADAEIMLIGEGPGANEDAQGRPFIGQAGKFLVELLAQRRRERFAPDHDCEMRFNMMAINHDGQVALCCGVYDRPNMLGVHFLEAAHDDIQRLKYRHPFCAACYDLGLQYAKLRPEADAAAAEAAVEGVPV